MGLTNPASLVLDLANAKPKDILNTAAYFEQQMAANPDLGPIPVNTGWCDITPAIATNLLLRNRPGANRTIDPATIIYYADQMVRNDWQPTGQPIILTTDGSLADGQHRLFAIVISGATISTFVVADAQPQPGLFAYIDNSRPRSAATALQTAGFNGVAPAIAKIIKLAEEVRHGVFNRNSGISKLPRMSPHDVLRLVENYPHARIAARSVASDWQEAADYVDRKDVVGYLGMQIISHYGEEAADEFFADLADNSTRAATDPMGAGRKLIDQDKRSTKPMKRQHVLGCLIKVFNAWRKEEPLPRRWVLQVNEDFPAIEIEQPRQEAAE